MPGRSEEAQAAFEAALRAIAEEEALSMEQLDALNVLEGADLERFRQAWAALSAPARARTIRALRTEAEDRLRLDFSALNHLAMEDEDTAVRVAGVECALEDHSERRLTKLLDLLRSDPSFEVRRAAAEDLARFALLGELEGLHPTLTARLREWLQTALHDEQEAPGVRTAALAALGYFSDEAILEELATAFTIPDLRIGAVRGMGRAADPRWTDRLMPVLGSEDPDQRVEAARALGEIEDPRAVGPLTEVIDDPEREVRLAVIAALGEIGTDEAREALFIAMEDEDEEIREAAEKALGIIEFFEDPLEL